MEIYADAMFLINFCVLYVCLTPSAAYFKIQLWRRIVSSASGALWGVISFIIFEGGNIVASVMGLVITGVIAFQKNFKAIAVFFVFSSLVYTGLIIFIPLLRIGADAVIKNGIVYFDIPFRIFFIAFMVAFFIAVILERIWKQKLKKQICRLKITKDGASTDMNAIYDTGNLLTEPISGRRVILVRRDALSPLDTDKILTTEKPFVIPYHSLGHNGALIGFLADEIMIDNSKKISGAVIGICDEKFGDECDALIGGI